MNRTPSIRYTVSEAVYEKPLLEIVNFSTEDIMTASVDQNMGEWDEAQQYSDALSEN